MKRFITMLLVAISFFAVEVHAKSSEIALVENAYSEQEVDEIPTFGGAHFSEFAVWLRHYVSFYTLNNRIREEAYVRCIIDKTGKLSNVEVYNCSGDFERAIERATKNAPLFTPAIKSGYAVNYRTSFAISFRAKYEQVYNTTTYYRDSYYYRNATTFQRMNNSTHMDLYSSSVLSNRNADRDPTQYYGVSYYSRTKVTDKTVYKNVEVNSSECEHFEADEVDSYPLTSDGKPFVEYIDWIMEAVYPVIAKGNAKSRVSFNYIKLGMLIDKDGTVYPTTQMLTSKNAIYRAVVKRIAQSPKLLPATKDGKAVRYNSTTLISQKRASIWHKLSFADQTRWSMAEDIVFGSTDVDVLPRYDDTTIDSYLDEVTRKAFLNIPDNIRGGIEDDVSVDVIIDKSGKMSRIEVVDANCEELLQATVDAVKSMSQHWVPATVYGKAVDSRLGVTISFGDVYSEYVDSGRVGVARYNKPEFKRQDARRFIDWVKSRVKMPNGVKKFDYRGMAFVSFVVEIDGSLSDVEVIRSSDAHLAAEVERIIKSSPKWYAGVDDNGKARVRIAVPIVFI